METRNIVEIITDKKLAPRERFEQVQDYIKNLVDPKILEVPYEGDTALTAAVRLDYSDCVRVLIDAKVNIDAKPKECMLSPLHWAAYKGHRDCLKLLLEAKVNVNEISMHGNTALGHAAGLIAKSRGEQKECVRLLLTAGAELNLESYNDSDVRTLYKILLEGDSNDLQTRPAFEALLRINEKVKLREIGRDKNSIMFMSKALKKDEVEIINKILKKSTETSQLNSSGFFMSEQTSETENKKTTSSRCLIM